MVRSSKNRFCREQRHVTTWCHVISVSVLLALLDVIIQSRDVDNLNMMAGPLVCVCVFSVHWWLINESSCLSFKHQECEWHKPECKCGNLSVSVSVCLCVISIKSSQSNFTDNHIRIMVNCWIEIWMYAGMFAFLQSSQKTIQLTNESFKSIKPFKLVVLWNFVFLHYYKEHKIVLT